jgi:hypothetical protein
MVCVALHGSMLGSFTSWWVGVAVGGVHAFKGPLLPQKEVAKAFELCKPIMLLCETDDRYGK